MTQHVHFEQAPPRSWDQFEELCADTFQEEWQDSTLVRHGRTGQTQHGVGRDGANWPVGIQCKRKSLRPVSEVTTRDLERLRRPRTSSRRLGPFTWCRLLPTTSRCSST